jgi:hypothetical protein
MFATFAYARRRAGDFGDKDREKNAAIIGERGGLTRTGSGARSRNYAD